jgi:hypothetical protein
VRPLSFCVQINHTEFRGTLWNLSNFSDSTISHDSVEFMLIPYSIQNIQKKEKHAEFRVDGILWNPRLTLTFD